MPTFNLGWKNYGGGYDVAGYCRDPMAFVHLKGLIGGGTVNAGSPIFVLPEGFRPAAREISRAAPTVTHSTRTWAPRGSMSTRLATSSCGQRPGAPPSGCRSAV